ncbi:MAG: RNA pyrophosphohydrolase [Hyphomicrobium sp.]|uniref:RNA pyrophosphohydrolase n=1 Tax=Hyphomicrobium sp. TaxID=82 RepID=UPI003D10F674
MTQATLNQPPLDLPYRSGVGIMLINRDGRVFTGRRLPKWVGDKSAYVWQMPQGGLLPGEAPIEAAFRELEEETGVTSADIVGEIPEWLTYELPEPLLGVALKGKYRGQRQRWFAMRFWGDDSEIDIRPRNGKAEFDRWRWREMSELPEHIVSFKRPVYQTVVDRFAYLAQS